MLVYSLPCPIALKSQFSSSFLINVILHFSVFSSLWNQNSSIRFSMASAWTSWLLLPVYFPSHDSFLMLCITSVLLSCPTFQSKSHLLRGPQLPKITRLDLQRLISQRFFIYWPSLLNFCCKNIPLIFSWSSALLSFYCSIFTIGLWPDLTDSIKNANCFTAVYCLK